MNKLILACALTLGASAAHAGSLTTLFGGNNFGSLGGAVYFDVTIGGTGLIITGYDTNTDVTVPFGFEVFTRVGTYVGNTTSNVGWNSVATGSGVGQGLDNPTPVTLNNTFVLNANTTYGMALVMSSDARHNYTNGNGSNQFYSNSDLSLNLGAASNVPFTGNTFSPRVWNGTIYYDPVPEPASMAILGLGALALARRKRRK
ncbi:PEP-CTERM sorting domain-containing protein [Kamptonema cortianum]|nr:PEP-CTERM sorting domain-containing protein [Geitlerinema splendidum]MDK3157082.1 PEP-CTERM sorting domain-containing protein [Kamptonema cortianum]